MLINSIWPFRWSNAHHIQYAHAQHRYSIQLDCECFSPLYSDKCRDTNMFSWHIKSDYARLFAFDYKYSHNIALNSIKRTHGPHTQNYVLYVFTYCLVIQGKEWKWTVRWLTTCFSMHILIQLLKLLLVNYGFVSFIHNFIKKRTWIIDHAKPGLWFL